MTTAVAGRISYLRQQITYHTKQIEILQEELDELEDRDDEEAPEVEVTYERSPEPVEAPERPLERRRSGAKNLSAPEYQNAFISEARASMGMPSIQEAEAMVGKYVVLVFNSDVVARLDVVPVRGVLTAVTTHPSGVPSYVVLDDDQKKTYPLNSIQSIKEVP